MMTSHSPFDVVCFDCDSTLSTIEGIDEIARRANLLHQIAPLTDAAMNGEISIEDVYAKRLEILRPQRDMIAWLSDRYKDEAVADCQMTVATLLGLGKEVHIISGGLRPSILPFAEALGIPEGHVHAVEINFEQDGAYAGFDTQSPLVRPGGKADIIQQILATTNNRSVAMIGDGLTDVRARDAGAYIIGFGGVVRRDIVVEEADIFIDGPSLAATLDAILSSDEKTVATGPATRQ